VRRSARVPLQFLAAAAVAVPLADLPAQVPVRDDLKSPGAPTDTAIERGGFGIARGGWPFLLVVGAAALFLLARSGGE